MIDTTENSQYRMMIKTILEKFFVNTCLYIEENYEMFLKIFWENNRINFEMFKD